MDKEEIKERVIREFSDCSWSDKRHCGWAFDDAVVVNQPCHAGFSSEAHKTYKPKFLMASSFVVLEGYEEIGKRYWGFMTGDKSPWRSLWVLADWKPEPFFSTKHGRQLGFFVAPDGFNFRLCRNYFIAMRMIGEYPDTIKQWAHYVDVGLSEPEALLLARMYRGSTTSTTVLKKDENDGNHWPINRNNFSYKRFLFGRPKLNIPGYYSDSRVWGEKRASSFIEIDLENNKEILFGTRFSKKESYPSAFVAEKFHQFVLKQLENEKEVA